MFHRPGSQGLCPWLRLDPFLPTLRVSDGFSVQFPLTYKLYSTIADYICAWPSQTNFFKDGGEQSSLLPLHLPPQPQQHIYHTIQRSNQAWNSSHALAALPSSCCQSLLFPLHRASRPALHQVLGPAYTTSSKLNIESCQSVRNGPAVYTQAAAIRLSSWSISPAQLGISAMGSKSQSHLTDQHRFNSSSSSSSSSQAEGWARRRRKLPYPTWLHILRRKRHTREKRRAAAAVVRRAKRDGSMATPKGIKVTSLTALRAAPVWPSLDSAQDFAPLLPHYKPPATSAVHPAATRSGASSNASSSEAVPASGLVASSSSSAATNATSSAGSSVSSSEGVLLGSTATSTGESVRVEGAIAGGSGVDAIGTRSRSRGSGGGDSGHLGTSGSGRAAGKRSSLGRGGSASGRVWPMDPPELTGAISRCSSLKGLAQILDIAEDGSSPETGSPAARQKQAAVPGLRLRAAHLALHREERALAAEMEGRLRKKRSSLPIILTAAFNQFAWLQTRSPGAVAPWPSRAEQQSPPGQALPQALLHWMFATLLKTAPVLDARGVSTIIGALGVLRQAPPAYVWAALVARLMHPAASPANQSHSIESQGGRLSQPRASPILEAGTLMDAMDAQQLVDLSAGLARLKAGPPQLWACMLESAAAAAGRRELSPSQLPLVLWNVKQGGGRVVQNCDGDEGEGLGAHSGLIFGGDHGESSSSSSSTTTTTTSNTCSDGGSNAGRSMGAGEQGSQGDNSIKSCGKTSNILGESIKGCGNGSSRSSSGGESGGDGGSDSGLGLGCSSTMGEVEDMLGGCSSSRGSSSKRCDGQVNSHACTQSEALRSYTALQALLSALPPLLPQMGLMDMAITLSACRAIHILPKAKSLSIMHQRLISLLVQRQQRRKQQAERDQLQQRLKEAAAGVLLRRRAGCSQQATTGSSASQAPGSLECARGRPACDKEKEDARALRMLRHDLAAVQLGGWKLRSLLQKG